MIDNQPYTFPFKQGQVEVGACCATERWHLRKRGVNRKTKREEETQKQGDTNAHDMRIFDYHCTKLENSDDTNHDAGEIKIDEDVPKPARRAN